MGEKFNRFKENLKNTVKNIGASGSQIMDKLEKADKEIDEKMKDILK